MSGALHIPPAVPAATGPSSRRGGRVVGICAVTTTDTCWCCVAATATTSPIKHGPENPPAVASRLHPAKKQVVGMTVQSRLLSCSLP
jgi:hypothetical protein